MKFKTAKGIVLAVLSEQRNKKEFLKCLKDTYCFVMLNANENQNGDGKSVISPKEQHFSHKVYKGVMRVNTTNERGKTK